MPKIGGKCSVEGRQGFHCRTNKERSRKESQEDAYQLGNSEGLVSPLQSSRVSGEIGKGSFLVPSSPVENELTPPETRVRPSKGRNVDYQAQLQF